MALGEKRNGSVFATAAQRRDAAEYQVTSEPEVVPVVVDDTPQRTLNTDIGTLGRAHNLFFTPSAEGRDFNSVLQEVQEYISGAYAALITEGGEDSKEQLMRYITKYLQDRRIAVAGMTQAELVDAIYSEMAEFGFLTRYIYADGIEEININSWRDIEVQYSDGRSEKLTEHFDSPEHALAVIRRMLHASGMVLDNASPLVTGHLTRNTRIAAMKSPVVDEDVGVAASIRIVNRHNLSREDLLRSGTATAEMLDWLSVFLRYGISICVAGATSSGKTTAAGWLLTTIPDSKRIFTIENGSRELELVREENGKVVNSVVHTLTRDSENERQRIDQIALVDICLRFNPDILVVGEMRGAEANAAQEAARVGVAVLTTIHSNSCEATYAAWSGSRTEKASNGDIISSLGIGIVRFNEVTTPPEINDFDYEYRVNTEVITSVEVRGGQSDPDNPVSVRFNIQGRTYTVSNVYYPDGDSQLAWVRWRTPAEPCVITISVSVYGGGSAQGTITCNIVELDGNDPPNPLADDRNDAFRLSSIPEKEQVTSASWGIWSPWWQENWEWVENWQKCWHTDRWTDADGKTHRDRWYHWVDNGWWEDHGWWEFDYNGYSASLTGSMKITPDEKSPTATASTLKSGYGVQEKVTAKVTTNQSSAVTAAQNAVTYFPEFGYESYWRLLEADISGRSTTFQFKANPYSTYNRRTHFTPIWYPDASYTPYTWLLDCWTPAGMLSMNLTDSVTIRGNLWEEWHIAPAKQR